MMKILFRALVLLIIIGVSSCAEDTEFPIDQDELEKFIGIWSVSDNALKINYEVNIERSATNTSKVILNNFAGSGDAAEGLVAGKSIVISYQEVGQSWYVNGTGTYVNDSRLDFNYTLDIGGNEEERRAVFTK
jgi:hypothetical protein